MSKLARRKKGTTKTELNQSFDDFKTDDTSAETSGREARLR